MRISEMIKSAVNDAIGRLEGGNRENDLTVFSWPQKWIDENVGFKTTGCGGDFSISDDGSFRSQTTVVMGKGGDVCVYHGKRLAFYIDKPSEDFWQRVSQHDIPGRGDVYVPDIESRIRVFGDKKQKGDDSE